jgi:hypothetical protein
VTLSRKVAAAIDTGFIVEADIGNITKPSSPWRSTGIDPELLEQIST